MTENIHFQSERLPEISISEDGLVRLPYEIFTKIPIVHLYSELNDYSEDYTSLSNGKTHLRGLTEWISSDIFPIISIGWQWKLDLLSVSSEYTIDSEPFSNIMFVNGKFEDQGKQLTDHLLIKYINRLNWNIQVKEYLNEKYT